jgi:F-type H+-transporting ATPase subunit delta
MASDERAEVYARSLFALAQLGNAVDAADETLRQAAETFRSSAELRDALGDPNVPAATRRDIVRDLFAAGGPAVAAVVGLMADNSDGALLSDVSRIYGEVAEKERGLVVAYVTTAVALDDTTRADVVAQLKQMLDAPVSLREKIDPSIIGGIVINVAGKIIDASVSGQLDGARRVLSTPASNGGEA